MVTGWHGAGHLLHALLPVLLAGAAAAQGLRDSDTRFGAADLTATLSGHTIEFFDGSKSRYDADGSYQYTYTDADPPHPGRYAITDDGRVCVAFDNGFSRCDAFVSANGRLTLVNAEGTRFPIRTRIEN